MAAFGRFLAELPLLIASPFLIAITALSLAVSDLLWVLLGSRRKPAGIRPRNESASVVIPNWNGRDLLEKYLPSVIEAMGGNSQNEIVVVDNGSTDGSADFIEQAFPSVRVVRLSENKGFGGGSNAGFRAARNDIVVLLNSDMRVEADFLVPLLRCFDDDLLFAVSCQIFFSDPGKAREETGLTQGWWEGGHLRVRHRLDIAITEPFPCFYGGGGSCAFDRSKFLELGGFDELMRPFYLEDTDLGYMAWKRGWKVLYQPASVVYHEHRGTIGKRFTKSYIDGVVKKNLELFTWKNIHEWKRLGSHLLYSFADGFVSVVFGTSPERADFRGLARAFVQLPQAIASRWRARSLSVVSDTEAFRRPLAGYYRDRFQGLASDPAKLSVLFVSPYPICPPTHGGGVFMFQTCMELAGLCDLHLLVLLDYENQRPPHDELVAHCASADFLVRVTGRTHAFGSPRPHAVSEFAGPDVEWAIHRILYLKRVDVLQLEYTPLGQYGGDFRQIVTILFEHDIYFQSIGRQLGNMKSAVRRASATFEYLRALRYELRLLPKMDRIQVCSTDNRDYLLSYVPSLQNRIDPDLRAGIDTSRYPFRDSTNREPDTMLFLGGFRHLPNQEALDWFTRLVLPRILERKPRARLIVIGSDPPPRHSLPHLPEAVELRGFVEDVLEPLAKYAVFVCPILSGSGVRVKLLEAFAAGIPVVSTSIGAEGLATVDGHICAIADEPQAFADRVIELLDKPERADAIAIRAREQVAASRDMAVITRKLERSYRVAVRDKRKITSAVSEDAEDRLPTGR
jgi:O-antigen biosynthesis protein